MERIRHTTSHGAYRENNCDTQAANEVNDYLTHVEEEIEKLLMVYKEGISKIRNLKKLSPSENYKFNLTIWYADPATMKKRIDQERDRIRALVKADVRAAEKAAVSKNTSRGKTSTNQQKPFDNKEHARFVKKLSIHTGQKADQSMVKKPVRSDAKPDSDKPDRNKTRNCLETGLVTSTDTIELQTPKFGDSELPFSIPTPRFR